MQVIAAPQLDGPIMAADHETRRLMKVSNDRHTLNLEPGPARPGPGVPQLHARVVDHRELAGVVGQRERLAALRALRICRIRRRNETVAKHGVGPQDLQHHAIATCDRQDAAIATEGDRRDFNGTVDLVNRQLRADP